jgi:hypothetical protein
MNPNPMLLDPGRPPSESQHVPSPNYITKPYPIVKGNMKYYTCTERNASMHRPDGKKIAFIFMIAATDDVYDQQYLEHEIATGNQFLRHATPDEVDAYKMRIDPRGTIRQQVKSELEISMRAELEAKIRAELENEYASSSSKQPVPVSGAQDEAKISGTSTAQDKLKALAALRTGTATITPLETPPSAALKPVSTADIVDGAKQSGL